jgi:hypothetical protein
LQIETLARKSNILHSASSHHAEQACATRLIASSNLQKDRLRGVNGVAFEYDADLDLTHFESLTERVFGGVSFVRCMDSSKLQEMLQAHDGALQNELEHFCKSKKEPTKKNAKLNDVMPGPQTAVDFYWANVAIKYVDDRRKNTLLIDDFNQQRIVFHNLCICVKDDHLSQCADYAVRDAAPWESVLDGYMGLYKQQHNVGESYFLGCSSHMPGMATTFVTSLKQDLSHGTTIAEYANSKEMWFIENINRRNRLRLLHECAQQLGFQIIVGHDLYAHADMTPETAYEAFGHMYEYIEITNTSNFADLSAQMQVCHYLGCTSASTIHEPIPFELNLKDGFEMLYAMEHQGQPLDMMFSQNTHTPNLLHARDCVVPTINVKEQSFEDIHAIESQVAQMRMLTPDEILFTAHQTDLALTPIVFSLLHTRDVYNQPLVYGIQYPDGLPIVLYPVKTIQHTVKFDKCTDFDSFPDFQDIKSSVPCTNFRKTYQESMCLDTEIPIDAMFSASTTQQTRQHESIAALEWDSNMLDNILLFSGYHRTQISTCRLTPLLVYHHESSFGC